MFVLTYMLSYTHIIFDEISFHHSDQSAASNLSSMSSSSQSVARLRMKGNSEYIDMNRNLDEDSNAEINRSVAKKRNVACITNRLAILYFSML